MTPGELAVERDWLLEHGRSVEEVQRGQAAMAHASVWLVIGTCGAYSDRSEWVVAAYFDKTLAERHADLAMEEERRLLKAWTDAGNESYGFRRIYQFDDTPEMKAMRVNRYDPKVQRDYTDTDYHAAEVCELRLSLPESTTAASTSVQREGR